MDLSPLLTHHATVALIGRLTQGLQVGVGEVAEVKVQALQAREESQVSRQLGQPTRQAFVTGQVQLTQCGEPLERTTFRDTGQTRL